MDKARKCDTTRHVDLSLHRENWSVNDVYFGLQVLTREGLYVPPHTGLPTSGQDGDSENKPVDMQYCMALLEETGIVDS
jgi:hypothetical protein